MENYVTKADGSRQLFDREKIIRTCLRMGATRTIAYKIVREIENQLYDGIKTEKILKIAQNTGPLQIILAGFNKINDLATNQPADHFMNGAPWGEVRIQRTHGFVLFTEQRDVCQGLDVY